MKSELRAASAYFSAASMYVVGQSDLNRFIQEAKKLQSTEDFWMNVCSQIQEHILNSQNHQKPRLFNEFLEEDSKTRKALEEEDASESVRLQYWGETVVSFGASSSFILPTSKKVEKAFLK